MYGGYRKSSGSRGTGRLIGIALLLISSLDLLDSGTGFPVARGLLDVRYSPDVQSLLVSSGAGSSSHWSSCCTGCPMADAV